MLQIQACLRMVMEWASRSGLGHLAEKFFTKLNSTVSILATHPQQLTQVTHREMSFLFVYDEPHIAISNGEGIRGRKQKILK